MILFAAVETLVLTASIRSVACVVLPESASSVQTSNHITGPVRLSASVGAGGGGATVTALDLRAIALALMHALTTVPSVHWLAVLHLLLAIHAHAVVRPGWLLVLWSGWLVLLVLGPAGVAAARVSAIGRGTRRATSLLVLRGIPLVLLVAERLEPVGEVARAAKVAIE